MLLWHDRHENGTHKRDGHHVIPVSGIAAYARIDLHDIDNYREAGLFPEPVVNVDGVELWRLPDIEQWIEAKTGRTLEHV